MLVSEQYNQAFNQHLRRTYSPLSTGGAAARKNWRPDTFIGCLRDRFNRLSVCRGGAYGNRDSHAKLASSYRLAGPGYTRANRLFRGVHRSRILDRDLRLCSGSAWRYGENLAESFGRKSERRRASGLRLTFDSRRGFPGAWMHASLAHANRNFHH